MGIVGVIFINLFQAFVFASIASIIQKYKYTKRDYVLIFIGIVIPSMVFYFLFERYSLFYLIFAFFIFYYKRLKIIGVLSVLVTVIVLILSDFISSWAYAYMSTLNVNFYTANVFYAIIFVLCCYLFSIILVFLFNKFKLSWLHLNKLYLSILIAFLATVFYVFFFLTPKSVASFNEFKSIGTFYFLLFSAIAILIFMTTITIAREISYRHKKQEAEDYYKYTLEMEKVNNRMRKFRHDYINILATMSEYLREDDLEGLKEYYHNNISPLKGHFETNSLKLNGIEKLKVREIKGVITTKILSAQENNIEISVEVADEITSINMEIIDLSRVLGIIMDNAIEASLTVEDPMIQIAFIKTETSVLIIIMNKAPKNMPKLHTLFQEGFSTKGKNRGIGLSTLKEITDKTENVLLDTTIENQYFIQKIEVMNDDD
ncbi:quorum-sensing sensor histidine kinase AgrC [Staphylococcus coagulans]|uniref:quorum-sensing sensor histidine kinase AgrC n=1 Tax=Staphylococcus coagulans TaxID=74706 RepID=UPI0015F8CBD6|nr:GHKL domain-containing protein [Staphylococcus coagulans]MBA8765012.1 GHKL domain-containing protein [Staphylococcus coagulans]MBT2819531.1 GHKL domain-containing protein [Staphylococcus coagulans]MBT2824281.1 GHKL domain-containing protein [Staphylococcus coagulans]MBT2835694.1 GHKL domain-containing protein [Staphylococcus coagulans]MBT2840253.1 GHKL domain-containing protein [Staphylococcus coagulans]